MIMRMAALASLALGLAEAPLWAQEQVPAKTQGEQSANDKDQRVCETVTMLGSRLNKRRFCGTRAEWDEKRMRDRQELEKAQLSACVLKGGC